MSNSSTPKPVSPSEAALQRVMQRANIPSQRALAEKANVSRWQVQQLRLGNIDTMRLSMVKRLAAALDCSLAELLQTFSPEPSFSENTTDIVTDTAAVNNNNQATREATLLRQEYARLEQRLEQQSQQLRYQFQSEALQGLESWLTYWPTAAKAAIDHEGFDARKLLPLVKPVERLVASWGVSVIGAVGEQLAYDPQQHQLARGVAAPGDSVRISHVGYRHGDNLLQRAKVVPMKAD